MLGPGFEPGQPFRATDLQSVAIDHSATPAKICILYYDYTVLYECMHTGIFPYMN